MKLFAKDITVSTKKKNMSNLSSLIRLSLLQTFLVAITASCGVCKKTTTVVKEEIHHIYKDSTIINVRDSVVTIPVEKVINVTLPGQESELETSLAKSKAYTDTLGFLHHNLENKKSFTQHIHTEQQLTSKQDTVYIKEPVPYEVIVDKPYIPKFYKFTLYWFIGTVLLIILFLFLKIRHIL